MWMQVAPRLRRRVHAWHVAVSEDPEHARGTFGGAGVDRNGATVGDCAVDDRGVRGILDGDVGRIWRPARHLQPAIRARDRLSDGVHARSPAVSSARKATRWASSTLKPLWARGRALS